MKLAYLILAHKNPKQLAALVSSISHPQAGIFIHLDKRVKKNPFLKAFSEVGVSAEYIIQDQKIIYSSITYIYATLKILKEAYERGYDYFVLISGQDWPLKPNEEIVSFFKQNKKLNYFEFHPIPYNKLVYKGLMRTNFYSFKVINRMETLFPLKGIKHKMSWKGKALNYFLWLLNLGKDYRLFPLGMQPYYGSQWWNLSRDAVEYIFKFLGQNPGYFKFHNNSYHPEEMFFQTIILNSDLFLGKIVNENLRYIKWKEGNKHPEVIKLVDVKKISPSNRLFARKLNEIDFL